MNNQKGKPSFYDGSGIFQLKAHAMTDNKIVVKPAEKSEVKYPCFPYVAG